VKNNQKVDKLRQVLSKNFRKHDDLALEIGFIKEIKFIRLDAERYYNSLGQRGHRRMFLPASA
jgi:hypothetical protein